MKITLTAGGRAGAPPKPERTQTAILNEWESTVRRMLELSAATHGKRERILTMRRWLEANEWHEKHQEREQQYFREYQALNDEFGRLMDMSTVAARIQNEMNDETKAGMSALLGHELFPNAPCVWLIYAQRLGTDDLFAIASSWLMEMRAEDERMAA